MFHIGVDVRTLLCSEKCLMYFNCAGFFLVLETHHGPEPLASQLKMESKLCSPFLGLSPGRAGPRSLQVLQTLFWVSSLWTESHAALLSHFSSHMKTYKTVCFVFHCDMALFSFSYGKYMILDGTTAFQFWLLCR